MSSRPQKVPMLLNLLLLAAVAAVCVAGAIELARRATKGRSTEVELRMWHARPPVHRPLVTHRVDERADRVAA